MESLKEKKSNCQMTKCEVSASRYVARKACKSVFGWFNKRDCIILSLLHLQKKRNLILKK